MRSLFSISSLGLLALVLAIMQAAARDAAVRVPPKGSPLRALLLDTARPAFEKEVGPPVEFVVKTLNVWEEWAFGDVRLQRPGGKPIDWRRTKFAEDIAQGVFETGSNFFLLQRTGDGWMLAELAIGPTDVAWDWWRQQRKLPYELFGVRAEDFDGSQSARPRSGN